MKTVEQGSPPPQRADFVTLPREALMNAAGFPERLYRPKSTRYVVVLVVLALLPTLALGQSMRCGSELITKGTTQAKVAALCGQPWQT